MQTLRATTYKFFLPPLQRPRRCGGFSLLEILIAMALIAIISVIFLPSFTAVFRTTSESFSHKISGLLRQARDRAFLKSKLVRFRVDLDKQEYWLEEAPASYLMTPKVAGIQSLREKEEAQKKEEESFTIVNDLTKQRKQAPKGVRFVEIINPRLKGSAKEGICDTYFYPNGNADASTVHLEDDEKIQYSIIVHPITGQALAKKGFEEPKR